MSKTIIGYGKSYASFGEVVQGRLSRQEDFLVTLPVDMWSTCELHYKEINGPSVVEVDLEKSRKVAESMLQSLVKDYGAHIKIKFSRNIPIGKGLSSSTADMLSVVRAFQEVFGVIVGESFISRLFNNIEPHDGLHYYTSVVYNHRRGVLLNRLNYIPDFKIIGVDFGGEVCTELYNRNVVFTDDLVEAYDELYADLLTSFSMRDDRMIANCATRSLQLHIKRTGLPSLSSALIRARKLNVLGVLVAHSGTCVGFILPGETPDHLIRKISHDVRDLGDVFVTRTLKMLD